MARNHFAVFDNFMNCEAMAEADDQAVATWLRLARYASIVAMNRGRIVGARKWSDRVAMRLAGVTPQGIAALVAARLGDWDGDDLELIGYDLDGEQIWQAKSEAGKLGARNRWRGRSGLGDEGADSGASGDQESRIDDDGKPMAGDGSAIDKGMAKAGSDDGKPMADASFSDARSVAERSEAERCGTERGGAGPRHTPTPGLSFGVQGASPAPALPPDHHDGDDPPVVLLDLDQQTAAPAPPKPAPPASPKPAGKPGALPPDAKPSRHDLAKHLRRHGLPDFADAVDEWSDLLIGTAGATSTAEAFDALAWIVKKAREANRSANHARLVGDLAHKWPKVRNAAGYR